LSAAQAAACSSTTMAGAINETMRADMMRSLE